MALLGRELVRDRPARRARDEAEPLLPVEPVDLVDDAVDVVVERGALLLDLGVGVEQLLDRPTQLGQRIDLEAPALEPAATMPTGLAHGIALITPQA